MVSILTNTAALGASRQLGITSRGLEQAIGRLTTGQRINRASDDAAGLGISNRLGVDIRTNQQGRRNTNDGISTLQVADGVLDEVTALLTRGVELAEQSSTGTLSDVNRTNLDAEFQNILNTIIDLGLNTSFNGQPIFGGTLSVSAATFGMLDVTIGTISTSTVSALGLDKGTLNNRPVGWVSDGAGGYRPAGADGFMQSALIPGYWLAFKDNDGNPATVGYTHVTGWGTSLGFADGGSGWFDPTAGWNPTNDGTVNAYTAVYGAAVATGFTPPPGFQGVPNGDNIASATSAKAVSTKLLSAIESVSNLRASLGAGMQQLAAVSSSLGIQGENYTAAFSQIRDANVADEVVQLTKFQILNQSGTNALSQANQAQQGLLSLLR